MKVAHTALCGALAFAAAGCTTTNTTHPDNTAGRQTMYEDVSSSSGAVQGIGIESQDIVGMTDKMMRDMLANPQLAGRSTPPRVIIDAQDFENQSSSRINKNMITDRLRIELNRAANGKLVFVLREFADVVEREKGYKKAGVTDGGTIRKTKGTAGADFKLVGRITSLDGVSGSGAQSRYQQISFEMLDLQYGTSVWAGLYEFKKSGQDDVIYR
jgi:PBP1b-binding outer membrane lipoprotein LpoB